MDVVPIYLFGNTSVLSALKHGPLASISRKFQVSLTWFWGKWCLPVPRDEKVSDGGFEMCVLERFLLFHCVR